MYFYQEMTQISRKVRTYLFLLFGIWIILAIVFIFLDLPLSILLVDYNSSWARFVALYGEIPGHIVISISLFILLCDRVVNVKWPYNLLFWLGLIINSVFIVNILHAVFPEYYIEVKKGVFITGFVVICQILIIMYLKNANMLTDRKYTDFAQISIILAILNPLLFVQSIKILWGRTRFRDLSGDYHEFTPWFIPQGITGNNSFPSGHTAMGWMVLPLLLLIHKAGRKGRIFQVMIYFWGFFIAIGRIVIGAHYASDVLFSSGMAFLIYILLKNHWKKYNSSNKLQISELS